MIAVNKIVQATLESVGVPVMRIFYAGVSDRYLTWQLISAGDREFSDDENGSVEYTYGVDIFAKDNLDQLVENTKIALKSAGFYDVVVQAEMYEDTTGVYHAAMQFSFTEVVDNG